MNNSACKARIKVVFINISHTPFTFRLRTIPARAFESNGNRGASVEEVEVSVLLPSARRLAPNSHAYLILAFLTHDMVLAYSLSLVMVSGDASLWSS